MAGRQPQNGEKYFLKNCPKIDRGMAEKCPKIGAQNRKKDSIGWRPQIDWKTLEIFGPIKLMINGGHKPQRPNWSWATTEKIGRNSAKWRALKIAEASVEAVFRNGKSDRKMEVSDEETRPRDSQIGIESVELKRVEQRDGGNGKKVRETGEGWMRQAALLSHVFISGVAFQPKPSALVV